MPRPERDPDPARFYPAFGPVGGLGVGLLLGALDVVPLALGLIGGAAIGLVAGAAAWAQTTRR